ncbi:flagellar hook-length control protein FliK [Thiomicrorhabdus lithotrophica]|uniref:Flagellar hook-length control protein FliK n=1 Tax=Thiomicrorhabdus lithotrophica TaxID=2949997 RepID=A0ABY8CBM7_9GAMM|nr:flagellar hook-length control protein FliK [Thiomicrorhabdus lithotrophica]WEJ63383.1 flagellar hook-length control protein FliK [Thiomicrorhabdus lithotrophica]
MLTSTKISQSEPAIIGLEPLDKGQALPQEAKFSELFSSMYSASKEESATVIESTTLSELPEEPGVMEKFSIANELLKTSARGELPGLVTFQFESEALGGDVRKAGNAEANTDIITLVENALATNHPVAEEAKLNNIIPGTASTETALNNIIPVTVDIDTTLVDKPVLPEGLDSSFSELSELPVVETLALSDVAELTNVSSFPGDSADISSVEKHLTENFNVHQIHDKKVPTNNVNSVDDIISEQLVGSEETVELALQQRMAEMPIANSASVAAQVANSSVVSNGSQPPQSIASSQTLTQWGAATSEAQAASSTTGQNSQSFSQGSQHQFSGQQQMMQFQAQKSQAIEQQMAVKATDELMVKSDSKESLLTGEFSTFDRRMQLPVGLQSIPIPVRSPQWGQALGQRVVFMANNQLQQAQITLNPEKLGPVQVKLHMDRDQQVHVTMTAQHGTTREAMENALPRLREMLEQSGINLGSVDVGDNKQFSEKNSSDSDSNHSHTQADGDEADLTNDMSPTKVIATDNIVDFYA